MASPPPAPPASHHHHRIHYYDAGLSSASPLPSPPPPLPSPQVALEIGRIVGEGEVLQIATIAELRAGESGFLTSQSLPRLGEKASLLKESLKQKLPARLHRNFEKLEEGSSDALHQARVRPGLCVGCATCMPCDRLLTPVLLLCSPQTHTASSLLALPYPEPPTPPPPLLSPTSLAPPYPEPDPRPTHRLCPHPILPRQTLASLVCCGEVEPRSASFVVLFRSRRAAATAVALARWPGEMLSAPGYVRVLPAPAPADIYWPNLLLTRERRAMHWYVGLAWTIALYLLFNLPVAFIQGLSSIRTLSKVPGLSCISDYIGSMGPAAVASFQGIAASLVLQASLYFTLYSGLFQLLSRMAGAISHTQICEWSAQRIMLFQIIFVILVSSITSSAFDTLGVALENPIDVPYLLAGTLPSQSSFFMHYLLNQILFAYLLEGAQLITLCTFVICKLSRRRPKAAKQPAADRPVANEPAAVPPTPSAPLSAPPATPPPAAPPSAAPPATPSALPSAAPSSAVDDDGLPTYEPQGEEARRQRLTIIYARTTLCSGIFLTFLFIAPLIVPIALVYFVPSYPLYAVLLRNVEGRPEVDTGGAMWERAIRFQTWTLLLSLVLLMGVLVLKNSPFGFVLVLISFIYVAFHTYRLRHRYSGIAAGLPVQRCDQLDHAEPAEPRWESLEPYARAGAAAALRADADQVGAGHLEIDELEPEIDELEPESESPGTVNTTDELLHPEPTDAPGAVHEKGA